MRELRILFAFLVVATLTATLPSCKKDKTNDKNSTTWAADNALAEKTFGDVKNISDEAFNAASNKKSTAMDTVYLGPCVLVTLDLLSNPYTLTIDFGTTNCLCNDGKYRRGKIITTFSGAYWTTGTVITHHFEDYFVDDNQVTGTMTVTNMGPNTSGHPIFNVSVSGSIIKANNGGTITWVSTRTNEWYYGYDTPQWWDDIYLITGSGSGTGTDGKNFAVTITSPLEVKLNCHWLVRGNLTIVVEGYPLIAVDYGDGTCDADAIATIDGVEYHITMP